MAEEKKTLLEKARASRTTSRGSMDFSDEMVELVFAWAHNDIAVGQVVAVIGGATGKNVYPRLAKVLQFMVMNGLLVADGWLKEK